MKIIKSGTNAILKHGNIEGSVEKAELYYTNIVYQFVYFYQGEIKSCWVTEHELELKTNEKQTIGFK